MDGFKAYLDALSGLNDLEKGKDVTWYFHPGMLFLSMDKWWGDFMFRATRHEGIDITYYSTDGKSLKQFTPDTRVAAWENGRVVRVCNDFLGKSIITEPDFAPVESKYRTLYVYAHVSPLDHIRDGIRVTKNEPIATVCDTRKNPLLPPHLHFSCFQVPKGITTEKLDWSYFSSSPDILFFNPWFLCSPN